MRTALLVLCLGLCVLVGAQWIRESGLRRELSERELRLRGAEDRSAALAEQVRGQEEEIRRLMEARSEAVTKREEMAAETVRLTGLLAERAAAVPPDYAETMEARNTEVARQNEIIVGQNAALKELVRERDGLAARLNARTREFNDLVRKQNTGRN